MTPPRFLKLRSRRLLAGAILGAAFLAAACTGEEVPPPAPTATAAAIVAATPPSIATPTPLVEPVATPATPEPSPIPPPTATVAAVAAPAATPTPVPATPTPRPAVAKATNQQGSGEYRAGASGQWAAIGAGASLGTGDWVRAGAGARVSVEFRDGSVLVLEPQAQLEIQTYSDSQKEGKVVSRVARVALEGGAAGNVREDLVYPPSVFEIVTAGEVITIRGTLREGAS